MPELFQIVIMMRMQTQGMSRGNVGSVIVHEHHLMERYLFCLADVLKDRRVGLKAPTSAVL